MQRDTRHFARRQRTWFRSVRDAVWMHPERQRDALRASVARFLEADASPSKSGS